jgi:hypothetical protein
MIRNDSGFGDSVQDAFSRQIQAFHAAILDNCDRAAHPGQSDAMVLRLRANALALAKVQLAMVALAKAGRPELVAAADHCPDEEPAGDRLARSDDTSPTPDEVPADLAPNDEAPMTGRGLAIMVTDGDEDRLLTGDALSRFVSSRLNPGESPHEVWQYLQEADPAKRRRNPALPGAGFRSPSG